MKSEYRNTILGLKNRVQAFHGLGEGSCLGLHSDAYNPYSVREQDGTLTPMDKMLDGILTKAEADRKADEAKMVKLITRARNKDPEAVQEVNELRAETIDLYVRAMGNWGGFFRMIPLTNTDQPVFIHTFRNPINVRYMAQDGGVRTYKAVKSQKQTFIDMKELSTEDLGYQMRDIQGTMGGPGSVVDLPAAAQATVDLSFELANKVDGLQFDLLNGLFGPFTTTGAKLDRTYIPNDRIITANLPITNHLVLAGNTTVTKFRLAVVKAIVGYTEKWGNVWGSPLRPTGTILVPSGDIVDLADEIDPTSTVSNPLTDALLGNFTTFSYLGVTWRLVPDVTLPSGTCYAILNKPAAVMYTKPQLDQEFVETFPKKNWETRSQTKVLALATAEPWRVNLVRVVYHS